MKTGWRYFFVLTLAYFLASEVMVLSTTVIFRLGIDWAIAWMAMIVASYVFSNLISFVDNTTPGGGNDPLGPRTLFVLSAGSIVSLAVLACSEGFELWRHNFDENRSLVRLYYEWGVMNEVWPLSHGGYLWWLLALIAGCLALFSFILVRLGQYRGHWLVLWGTFFLYIVGNFALSPSINDSKYAVYNDALAAVVFIAAIASMIWLARNSLAEAGRVFQVSRKQEAGPLKTLLTAAGTLLFVTLVAAVMMYGLALGVTWLDDPTHVAILMIVVLLIAVFVIPGFLKPKPPKTITDDTDRMQKRFRFEDRPPSERER